MDDEKIEVGDRVFVEQAYEDEDGRYQDAYAEVISIDEGGRLDLKFENEEVDEFLSDAEYYPADVEKAQ